MNTTSGTSKDAADKLVRGIKRKTGKQYSAEEKIRIVLAGLQGEERIAACRAYRFVREFATEFIHGAGGGVWRQASSPRSRNWPRQSA